MFQGISNKVPFALRLLRKLIVNSFITVEAELCFV